MTSVRTNVDPLQMSNLFLEEKTAWLDLTSKTDFLKSRERKIAYQAKQKQDSYVICTLKINKTEKTTKKINCNEIKTKLCFWNIIFKLVI